MSSEFDRISRYFAPLSKSFPGAVDLKDDAALVSVPADRDLVISTDTIVQTIHFLGHETPEKIARKLLRVTLSDLAAKGASPYCYTLNIAAPPSVDDKWLAGFSSGLREDQDRFRISLAGGDTVRNDGHIVLTITGFGLVPQDSIVRRSGARPGDRLYVTGTIGDAALGLRLSKGEFTSLDWPTREFLIGRYEVPEPPVEFGPSLIGVATASIDVSDGLAADAGHIGSASGVGIEIESNAVPVSDAAAQLVASDPELMLSLLTGGDDYQILAAIPKGHERAYERKAADQEIQVTRIGSVVEGQGISILDRDGGKVSLPSLGFQHM